MITAFLAPGTPIDPELLQRLLKASGGVSDLEQIGLALARLVVDLSLLDAAGRDVIIHPLISDYTRWAMRPEKREELQRALFRALSELFPNTRSEFWRITQRSANEGWDWLSPQREAHVVAVWKGTRSVADWYGARLSDRLSDLFMQRGGFARAREACEQALVISQRCVEKSPDDLIWQHSLAVSYGKLGDVLREIGDKAHALNAYQQAAAISRHQTKVDPDVGQWWRDLVVSLERSGDMQLEAGCLPEARIIYSECRSVCDQWAEKEPGNSKWRHMRQMVGMKLGDVLRHEGNSEGAQEAYRGVIAYREHRAQAEPSDAQLQSQLAVIYGRMGLALRDKREWGGARGYYFQALAIFRDLVQRDSENAQWQTYLAITLFHIAEILWGEGLVDSSEGQRYLVEAQDILLGLKSESRLAHEEEQSLLPNVEMLLREWGKK